MWWREPSLKLKGNHQRESRAILYATRNCSTHGKPCFRWRRRTLNEKGAAELIIECSPKQRNLAQHGKRKLGCVPIWARDKRTNPCDCQIGCFEKGENQTGNTIQR